MDQPFSSCHSTPVKKNKKYLIFIFLQDDERVKLRVKRFIKIRCMGKLNLIFSSTHILLFVLFYCKTFILQLLKIFLQILKRPKIDREIADQKLAELIIKS